MANYRIQARGADAADIYLYDIIGEGWDGGISAKTFASDLRNLGKVQRLNVRINSPGGNLFEGVAIHNELARHPAHKTVSIDAMALSIASVIAMAGDRIEMADNAMMMIHDPWMFAMGNADELRKTADIMDQTKANLVRTYAKRNGESEQQIADWMSAETWFDASQALQAGLIDAIAEPLAISNAFDLSRFTRVPAALKAQINRGRPQRDLRAARLERISARQR